MEKCKLPVLSYSSSKIHKKRKEVRQGLIKSSSHIKGGAITRIAVSDLKLLFELYDDIFFNNYFSQSFKGTLTFSFSRRMSRSAGKIVYPKNLPNLSSGEQKFELRMGIELFFQYYQLNREKTVNGIKTRDALEAFLLVFEHELCHLIELHCYKSSSCKQIRFKTLAANLFGHTAGYHQLPTNREIAGELYGLQVGDTVKFQVEEQVYRGLINAINKRATVMVPDPEGQFKDAKGRRYSKWYIPLPCLEKN